MHTVAPSNMVRKCDDHAAANAMKPTITSPNFTEGSQWQNRIQNATHSPLISPEHQVNRLLQETLLTITRGDQPNSKPPDTLPIYLYPLYNEQTKIGWDQLLHGRWTIRWTEIYNHLTITTKATYGPRKYSSTSGILTRWTNRCTAEHD